VLSQITTWAMDRYGKYKYIRLEAKQWEVDVQSTHQSRVQYGTRSYERRVNYYGVVDGNGGGGFQIPSFKFKGGIIMTR
jgi:hypothetical protein